MENGELLNFFALDATENVVLWRNIMPNSTLCNSV